MSFLFNSLTLKIEIMNRVVDIIEANQLFILISLIVLTFYLLWTTNSKLKQLSKQVSDLIIKLGSLEKNQRRNSIYKKKEESIFVKEIQAQDKSIIKDFSEKISDNMRKVEYSSTRLYVTQEVYDELVSNPEYELIINTFPRTGNHPRGFYKIPNNIARTFIESKQGKHNWNVHQNFKQDTIPLELRDYFFYK